MKTGKIIILSGATATGKTNLSIQIAQEVYKCSKVPVEIVNFDSLYFYKELNIGTAKPTVDERKKVHHHLIDIISAKENFNTSHFVNLATDIINNKINSGVHLILTGGSAFYLRALLKGMYQSTTIPSDIRSEAEVLFQKEGIAPFIQFLKEHDPHSFELLHRNDHYRIIRAYQHYKVTGSPISHQKKSFDELDPYDFTKNIHPKWSWVHYYLEIEKEQHLKIIERRTEKLFSDGLIQEVDSLLSQGYTGQEKPLKSIGYKEVLMLKEGVIADIASCQERVNISTRQLAKSQKTFFKKIKPKITLNPLEEKEKLIHLALRFIEK